MQDVAAHGTFLINDTKCYMNSEKRKFSKDLISGIVNCVVDSYGSFAHLSSIWGPAPSAFRGIFFPFHCGVPAMWLGASHQTELVRVSGLWGLDKGRGFPLVW